MRSVASQLRRYVQKFKGKAFTDNLDSQSNPKVDRIPPINQDLDLYWDPAFANVLDHWGVGNAWSEIPLIMANCRGKVLDIACGTGRVIEILSMFNHLEVYGCDISDLLIPKARERGISSDKLVICDATQTIYPDSFFDYAYSIGSLEHFTEDGIVRFVTECHRVVKFNSFHMLPVSRSNLDEGWTKTVQSFYNNSVSWWVDKFKSAYSTVYVLDSKWEDNISVGKWFMCMK